MHVEHEETVNITLHLYWGKCPLPCVAKQTNGLEKTQFNLDRNCTNGFVIHCQFDVLSAILVGPLEKGKKSSMKRAG